MEVFGNNKELKIGASVLSADFSNLESEIKFAEDIGADFIHWDLMDGHFVPNISFGPILPKALRDKTELPFSAHLMIENPEKFLGELSKAGIDLCILEYETCKDLADSLNEIRNLGMKTGVALKPETPLSKIEDFFEELDLVLIMTVEPGYGGQKLIPDKLSKIEESRRIVDERGLNTEIGVDGGVHEDTVSLVVEAGASSLVMGSAIYEGDVEISPNEIKRRYKVK